MWSRQTADSSPRYQRNSNVDCSQNNDPHGQAVYENAFKNSKKTWALSYQFGQYEPFDPQTVCGRINERRKEITRQISDLSNTLSFSNDTELREQAEREVKNLHNNLRILDELCSDDSKPTNKLSSTLDKLKDDNCIKCLNCGGLQRQRNRE